MSAAMLELARRERARARFEAGGPFPYQTLRQLGQVSALPPDNQRGPRLVSEAMLDLARSEMEREGSEARRPMTYEVVRAMGRMPAFRIDQGLMSGFRMSGRDFAQVLRRNWASRDGGRPVESASSIRAVEKCLDGSRSASGSIAKHWLGSHRNNRLHSVHQADGDGGAIYPPEFQELINDLYCSCHAYLAQEKCEINESLSADGCDFTPTVEYNHEKGLCEISCPFKNWCTSGICQPVADGSRSRPPCGFEDPDWPFEDDENSDALEIPPLESAFECLIEIGARHFGDLGQLSERYLDHAFLIVTTRTGLEIAIHGGKGGAGCSGSPHGCLKVRRSTTGGITLRVSKNWSDYGQRW